MTLVTPSFHLRMNVLKITVFGSHKNASNSFYRRLSSNFVGGLGRGRCCFNFSSERVLNTPLKSLSTLKTTQATESSAIAATSKRQRMLRALQSKTQFVSPIWRKASTAAPRSRVTVTKSHKKPSLAAVWAAKPVVKPISAPQKIKISRRYYSSQMPFRDMNKTDLEVMMAGEPGSFYLIDVRDPEELKHGTIPHSHNVPRTSNSLTSISLAESISNSNLP